jgi:arylsulfatase A-like enzyme
MQSGLTRRDLLRCGMASMLGRAAWAAPASRPNVLFLISDDLDCRLGCYGDPVAKTPAIDGLSARGVRFERAYCQFPLCNPTRSSVLSGRYPTSTGVLDNNTFLVLDEGQSTLPRYFERNGYAVAEFGKIHHGPNRGLAKGEPKPAKPEGWFTPEERGRQQAENPAYWDQVHSPYRNLRLSNPS